MKKYLIFIVGIIIGVAGTSYAAYKLKAEQVSFDKTNTGLNSDNVQEVLDELGINLNNGKQLIADAITGKGIETVSSDSFEIMAKNIEKLSFINFSNITEVASASNIKYIDGQGSVTATASTSIMTNKNEVYMCLVYGGNMGNSDANVPSSLNISSISSSKKDIHKSGVLTTGHSIYIFLGDGTLKTITLEGSATTSSRNAFVTAIIYKIG